MSLGTLCLWMNKHVYVPSMYMIPWNIQPISLDMEVNHFVLSGPFIRCMYYWDLRAGPVLARTLFDIHPSFIGARLKN